MEKLSNYINGRLLAPLNKGYIENTSPTNGRPYSLIPDSTHEDVDLAINSAKNAFKSWGASTKEFRSEWMMRLADAIDDNAEILVQAESFDNGKPEWLAKSVDIPRCSKNIRFFATAILHFESKSHDMDGTAINYTLKQPIGVAGCISPWNLPLYLLTWKIAPAIAAGNTVVAKPSEITPYTAYLFSKICVDIGFPEGVINIIHGYGKSAGSEIVKKCDIISFTGGTETGKVIASIAAMQLKKYSLELGGKNPTVICADANINLAVESVLKSSFLNQGQICLCGSRIFIEKSIYSKFKRLFLKKTLSLSVGDPKDVSSNLGAIVSKTHMEKILLNINLATREGGDIISGGKRVFLDGDLAGGYYLEPTIIENLAYDALVNQEEIFGPVVTIAPFEDEAELIKMCNSTKYGLAASIFSENTSRSHRLAARIDSGVIWVNTWLLRDLRIPFGGMKESGVGREGGYNSLDFFTETKNVCIKIEPE
jgi:aminomuconate-semialdehyde/2-hydroxymuconate-6-semialdehyde dehydrogenase